MKVSDYVKAVEATDQTKTYDKNKKEKVLFFGLIGEIGSLLADLKKVEREAKAFPNIKERLIEELGDVLWYTTAIANNLNLNLATDVLQNNLIRIQEKAAKGEGYKKEVLDTKAQQKGSDFDKKLNKTWRSETVTFNTFQNLAFATSSSKKTVDRDSYIVQMWTNAHELVEKYGVWNPEKELSEDDVAKALGDILWYLANLAKAHKISLNEVAKFNKDKTASRWPGNNPEPAPLFDEFCHRDERFPRSFEVAFEKKDAKTIVMKINGVLIGDPLEDNSYDGDDYRYHDALHIAFVAKLGWSPVFRALLMRKRKSCPNTNDWPQGKELCPKGAENCQQADSVEDGARAVIVEEAIAKMVHSYAKEVDATNLLDKQKEVSFSILKDIKIFSKGLEVEECKFWEWEKAILAGMKLYSKLRQKGEGTVKVNMEAREIELI